MTNGLLQQLPVDKRFKLLGEVTSLMLLSPIHQRYLVSDIGDIITPALDKNQFRIYHKGANPVAILTWAWLSDEVHEKYKEGNYLLKDDEWNSGKHLWFIDFIAPFGNGSKILADIKKLRHELFKDATFAHAIRPDGYGNIKRIMTFEW